MRAEWLRVLDAQQFTLVNRVADEIGDKLAPGLDALARLARSLPAASLGNSAPVQESLENRPGIDGLFDSIWITVTDGVPLGTYPPNPRIKALSVMDRKWFQAAFSAEGPRVALPIMSRHSGNLVVILAAPVRNRDGVTVAVLCGALHLYKGKKCSAKREQPRIDIGWQEAGAAQAKIYVRDNSAGFEMQYAHRLFGMFERLRSKAEFSGTGIGLALVRRIAECLGGAVEAVGKWARARRLRYCLIWRDALPPDPVEGLAQFLDLGGLEDQLAHPGRFGLLAQLVGDQAGGHRYRQVGADLLHLARHVQAGHAGHVVVAHHQVVGAGAQAQVVERRPRVHEARHGVAAPPQQALEHVDQEFVVVDV